MGDAPRYEPCPDLAGLHQLLDAFAAIERASVDPLPGGKVALTVVGTVGPIGLRCWDGEDEDG